jgi:hypothetical protein
VPSESAPERITPAESSPTSAASVLKKTSIGLRSRRILSWDCTWSARSLTLTTASVGNRYTLFGSMDVPSAMACTGMSVKRATISGSMLSRSGLR